MGNALYSDLQALRPDEQWRICIKKAAAMEPQHGFAAVWDLHKVTRIREFAKVLEVKYYGRLRKPELIAALMEKMTQPDILSQLLHMLNTEQWSFFQMVAEQSEFKTQQPVFSLTYMLSQEMGILQTFYHDGELIFLVPDEIKAAYKRLMANGLGERIELRNLVNDYASALVSLYGVVAQDEFIEIFNAQNKQQITQDALFPILCDHIMGEAGYCLWREYIVDDSFEEDGFRSVPWLLKARAGKPRYLPPRDELLRYADWGYNSMTPQMKTLGKKLMEYVHDSEEVADMLLEAHEMCMAQARMQEYFDLLESHDVVFDNVDAAQELIQLIADVNNHTRLWENYGHTPYELSRVNRAALPEKQESLKTGRNAPCPCGSGKKYKHCCGRSDLRLV